MRDIGHSLRPTLRCYRLITMLYLAHLSWHKPYHTQLKRHHRCYHYQSILSDICILQGSHLWRLSPNKMFNRIFLYPCRFNMSKITKFKLTHLPCSHQGIQSNMTLMKMLRTKVNILYYTMYSHRGFLQYTLNRQYLIISNSKSSCIQIHHSNRWHILIHLGFLLIAHWRLIMTVTSLNHLFGKFDK